MYRCGYIVGVVIRRYIDILIIIINFPYSTCIRSFFGSSILTSLFIFKCFFGLYNRRAERAPHLSYSGEKSSSYIYICFLYIYIYIYVRTSCTRALRANVGPAG